MHIEKLPLNVDLKQLTVEVRELLSKWPWHLQTQQVCLTHPEYVEDPLDRYYVGCMNLSEHNYHDRRVRESDFTVFNKELSGSYLERVFFELMDLSKGALRRFRLRRQGPQTCMRFHVDFPVPRYHLALETDENCFFAFRDESGKVTAERIPLDGHFYLFNPGVAHTAVNAGIIDRVHLVGSATLV